MGKNVKKRNWAFVLYPESAPKDWGERLQQTGLQCAISPLHDKDLNADNSPKKAHYHIIMCYSGPTSYNVVKTLTDGLCQPIPQALEQIRGYYRYFSHKDNPEKAQYDEREIQTINGFDIAEFVELTRAEVKQIKKQLQSLIRELGICEYADLMDFLLDSDMDTEYEVASCNTYFFDKYLASIRHRNGAIFGQSTKMNSKKNTEKNTEKNTICCPNCGAVEIMKKGKTHAGTQRMACKDCGKMFVLE